MDKINELLNKFKNQPFIAKTLDFQILKDEKELMYILFHYPLKSRQRGKKYTVISGAIISQNKQYLIDYGEDWYPGKYEIYKLSRKIKIKKRGRDK